MSQQRLEEFRNEYETYTTLQEQILGLLDFLNESRQKAGDKAQPTFNTIAASLNEIHQLIITEGGKAHVAFSKLYIIQQEEERLHEALKKTLPTRRKT